MTNKKLVLISLLNSLGTVVYIFAIALFLQNGQKIFGKDGQNFLILMAMLMLLVLSAAITGALVLGRPILLYIENRKAEAIKMFFLTLGWLFIAVALIFLIQILK